MDVNKAQLKQIPIEQLSRGRYQPRRQFDQHALEELAESIKSSGLIQPLVVRPLTANHYEIITGERRWRASALAGLEFVSCLVRDFTDEQAAAVTTIENIQREDLNPIEEAQAYSRLAEEFQYYHEEIASIIGKSRTVITNALRLLKLDPRIQTLLRDKQLSGSHGKVIAGLPENVQYAVTTKCIEHGWSVRKLEQETKTLTQMKKVVLCYHDPDISRLERVVSDQFGSQVKVDQDVGKRGGWLKIRYFDTDTLAGLLDKMGVDYE